MDDNLARLFVTDTGCSGDATSSAFPMLQSKGKAQDRKDRDVYHIYCRSKVNALTVNDCAFDGMYTVGVGIDFASHLLLTFPGFSLFVWKRLIVIASNEGMSHAHFDCSRGAALRTFFAASLGAVIVEKTSEEIGGKNIISLFQALVRGLFPTIVEWISLDLSIDDDGAYRLECDVVVQEPFEFDTLVRSLQHHWPGSLSERACLVCVDVFHELQAAVGFTSPRPLRNEICGLEAVMTLGVVWCLFDQLDVYSVTCSPIPWTTRMDDWSSMDVEKLLRPESVVGLPIHEDWNNFPNNTGSGLAVLRALTQRSTSNGSFPKMTLLASTKGSSVNGVNAAHLLIGRLLAKCSDGTQSENTWDIDHLVLLEANLDDMTAEHLTFCAELLLQQGAADVWTTPIVMKKGRAAHTLHCLCRDTLRDTLLRAMFVHSNTLGIRVQSLERVALQRRIFTVQTEWKATCREGYVDVKVGYLDGKVISAKAEFEHCKEVALEAGETIEAVSSHAVRVALGLL
jgi:pyridinium-3,5-bisthiocarboxylic acid mononucleotide nickel chelatase